jgi:hypothetical protein
MDDLKRLARAVAAMDYEAVIPLLDWLRENDDERHTHLSAVVGNAVRRDSQEGHSGARRRRMAARVAERARELFWMECCDDVPAQLRRLSAHARAYTEADDDEIELEEGRPGTTAEELAYHQARVAELLAAQNPAGAQPDA